MKGKRAMGGPKCWKILFLYSVNVLRNIHNGRKGKKNLGLLQLFGMLLGPDNLETNFLHCILSHNLWGPQRYHLLISSSHTRSRKKVLLDWAALV